MAELPTGASGWDLLVWFIVGGGAYKLGSEGRQWWVRRKQLAAAEPAQRAVAESKAVATADKVVELVEERMIAMAAEQKEMRAEIRELKDRVSLLEDELRAHNIPIPPVK